MDLVTLVTACALTVEPKLMHALIFEQSGGEPWSFSEAGQGYARVLPTIQDTIREARAVRPEAGRIRIGLAGLPTDPRSVTAVMFAPCPNITIAARQIAQLKARCKNASKPDPTYCAIAAYHGSWARPDTTFADGVRVTVEKGNAPNFDMPRDAYFDPDDLASQAPTSGEPAAVITSTSIAVDQERGWSSSLFPPKAEQANTAEMKPPTSDQTGKESRFVGTFAAASATRKTTVDTLFVPRSSESRP
jgi:hypothetical protein